MAIKDPRRILSTLPTLPGVYQFYADDDVLLYVGKAAALKKRVASYFHKRQQSPRISLMLREAASLEVVVTASASEALLLENNLIKAKRPKYNILFRDDKSYPFLCLTKHPYPRLAFYRGTVKPGQAEYFGPFPDTNAVRETINILQRVFRLRTCTDGVLATRGRPCLLHSIGRCSAPCVNAIAAAEYGADAAQARAFLRGQSSTVADSLVQNMETAANDQRYEEAAVLRDRLRALAAVRRRHFAEDNDLADADYVGTAYADGRACVNVVMVRGGRRVGESRLFPEHTEQSDIPSIVGAFLAQYYKKQAPDKIFLHDAPADWRDLAPHLQARVVDKPAAAARERVAAAQANAQQALLVRRGGDVRRNERLALLQKRLALPILPRRLECFDISHSGGEETVAARTVFIDGVAAKQHYRLYRIRAKTAGDDLAAMYEAVFRCYRRVAAADGELPSVLFIDGGNTQVAAALRALAAIGDARVAALPVIGVAKGASRRPGEETLIGGDGEVIRLSPTDGALHLIQALRDETHRFAVSGHRRRRDKKRSQSLVLDGIAGIGDDKKRRLMTAFGGLAALRAASAGELAKIAGIGPALAARIYKSLHP